MASVGITISGLSGVLTNEFITISQLTKKIDWIIQSAGKECRSLAKDACPVGTPQSTGKKGYVGGTLKKSITYKKTGMYSCAVYTTVLYAPYVEFGTRKMAAQPYLHPAHVLAGVHMMDKLRAV